MKRIKESKVILETRSSLGPLQLHMHFLLMHYAFIFCIDVILLIIFINDIKRMQTNNEQLFNKNSVFKNATKSTEQIADIQRSAPTSLIHFVQLHNKVD